ncbi:site-specific integrase [Undibacterium sp. Dicai25W]|uniref:site-specific integrase n=1 Tax=Undibacterium sp. Dicai25W TaxID=3413034 RepID=UPI003BF2D5A9
MANKLITPRVGVNGKVSYQVRIRESGVYRSKTFKSEKDAEKFIREIKSKIDKGESVDIGKIQKLTLGSIFTEYLKLNTVSDGKRYGLEKIKREIGKVPLSNFKTASFSVYLKTKLEEKVPDQARKKKDHPLYKGNMVLDSETGLLVRKTYSESTIRKIYYEIKTALEWHSKHYEYTFNRKPFDDNKPPKAWIPRDRILETGELEKLLDACDKMYVNQEILKCLILWQYYSCMRSGETLLMKWEHIHINETDPHHSYIFVPKENQKIADKKNAKDRKVPLRPEFYHFIKDRVMKLKKDGQVFAFGDYWTTSGVLGSRFRVICNNAKVDNFKIHDLRHCAVSWYFVNTSLTDIEISEISGHIELGTLKRYATLRHNDIGVKLWVNSK